MKRVSRAVVSLVSTDSTNHAAAERLRDATAAYTRHQESEAALRSKIASARRQLAESVTSENFEGAQRAKEQRDALEGSLAALLENKKPLLEKVATATSAAAEHYFAADKTLSQPSEVTVTRVVVLDPLSGDHDDATYLSGDVTIQLRVNGRSFESEAWHVEGWASENDFVVKHFKITRLCSFILRAAHCEAALSPSAMKKSPKTIALRDEIMWKCY